MFFDHVKHIMEDCAEAKMSLLMLAQVFFITFTVFPGVSNLNQVHFVDKHNLPVFWICLFNIFDCVGRYLGGATGENLSQELTLKLGWLRLLHVVVFIAFAMTVDMNNLIIDLCILLNAVVFAFGNGYLQTCHSMQAPNKVKEHQRKNVGLLVSFMIVAGIFGGSIIQAFLSKFFKH